MATLVENRREYAPLTWENIKNRMPLTKAARLMHKDARELRRAIERGELACIKFPDSDRLFLTPDLITEWVEKYCVYRKEPIPR